MSKFRLNIEILDPEIVNFLKMIPKPSERSLVVRDLIIHGFKLRKANWDEHFKGIGIETESSESHIVQTKNAGVQNTDRGIVDPMGGFNHEGE